MRIYSFSSAAALVRPIEHSLACDQRLGCTLRRICNSTAMLFTVMRSRMGASPFFRSFVFLMKNKTLKDARFITLIEWLKLRNRALRVKQQNIVDQCEMHQIVGLNPGTEKVPRFSLANTLQNPVFCLCGEKKSP